MQNFVVVVEFFKNKERSLAALERRDDFFLQLTLFIETHVNEKVEIKSDIRHSAVLASGTKIFPLGGVQEAQSPKRKFGTP